MALNNQELAAINKLLGLMMFRINIKLASRESFKYGSCVKVCFRSVFGKKRLSESNITFNSDGMTNGQIKSRIKRLAPLSVYVENTNKINYMQIYLTYKGRKSCIVIMKKHISHMRRGKIIDNYIYGMRHKIFEIPEGYWIINKSRT